MWRLLMLLIVILPAMQSSMGAFIDHCDDLLALYKRNGHHVVSCIENRGYLYWKMEDV